MVEEHTTKRWPGADPTFPDVASLPDGGLVLGAWWENNSDYNDEHTLAIKLTPTGALDPSFGTNGIAPAELAPGSWETIRGLVVMPSGRIVISGSENGTNTGLLALTPTGAVDASFGDNGRFDVTVDQQPWDRGDTMLLSPTGDLVIGGPHGSWGYQGGYALAWIRGDGQGFDTTFGGGTGVVHNDDAASIYAIAQSPGGALFAIMRYATDSGDAIARFTPDGQLDSGFSGDGLASRPNNQYTYYTGLSVGVDGAPVALTGDDSGKLVADRYRSDGAPFRISLDRLGDDGRPVEQSAAFQFTLKGLPSKAPIQGVPVVFRVIDGPNAGTTGVCAMGFGELFPSCDTRSSGGVTWSYRGSTAGTDTIQAYADLDGDGALDPDEPVVTTTERWVDLVDYVALGDSYSAGEGLKNDFPSDNACHRSRDAYSQLVQLPGYGQPIADSDASVEFWACSGARTFNVAENPDNVLQLSTSEQHQTAGSAPGITNEPRQLQTLGRLNSDSPVSMVTITLGGNDLEWADVINECVWDNCIRDGNNFPGTNQDFQSWVQDRLMLGFQRVNETIRQIRAAAPNAVVFVLGYPQLLPATPEEQTCAKLGGGLFGGRGLQPDEENYIRDRAVDFNGALQGAAAMNGVHFVPVTDEFAGHEICGKDGEYINGLSVTTKMGGLAPWSYVTKRGASFHPNQAGHRAYARALERYIGDQIANYAPLTDTGLPKNPGDRWWATSPVRSAAPTGTAAAAPGSGSGSSGESLSMSLISSSTALPASTSSSSVELGDIDVDTPTSGPCDNVVFAAGQAVSVSAGGFQPGAAVALAVETPDQPATAAGTVQADGQGHIAATVNAPQWSATGGELFGVRATGPTEDGGTQLSRTSPLPLAPTTPPCLVDDTATSVGGAPVTVNVLANDPATGLDPSTLAVTNGDNGTVTIGSDHRITYVPGPDFKDRDSFFYSVCNTAGVCSAAEVQVAAGTAPVDTEPPTITVSTPANGAVYYQHDVVPANYSCADTGSGLATCTGDVAAGAQIDTATTGPKTFSVTATDNAGNQSTTLVTYRVDPPLLPANVKPNLSPSVECSTDNGDGTFTVRFGYDNKENFDFSLPAGSRNQLIGPVVETDGPVTAFVHPNVVPHRPGRTAIGAAAFTARFQKTQTVSWQLAGRTVTVSVNRTTPRCA